MSALPFAFLRKRGREVRRRRTQDMPTMPEFLLERLACRRGQDAPNVLISWQDYGTHQSPINYPAASALWVATP